MTHTSPLTPADMWQAVAGRDRAADGTFVYAVSSTGIFCRPSCPSRRPHRDRVAFFATPDAAERGGFRPCRRCHPKSGFFGDPWTARIGLACAWLAQSQSGRSLAALARRVGGSPFHLQRNFKRLVGLTPRQYAEACRLGAVKGRLRAQGDITEAMLDAGYGSSSRFYERAVPRLGMTPSAYQRGGAGATVRYTIARSPVGRVLVAATDRGVCAVLFGESDAELRSALALEFPSATIEADAHRALSSATERIVAHLSGSRPRLDLPLDVQATAFQWQVWNALAAIPPGETRSYSDIAAAVGRPRAARAVARACAANRIALAIPCHRVVPAAGGAGGYRWGAERKAALLARERRARQDPGST